MQLLLWQERCLVTPLFLQKQPRGLCFPKNGQIPLSLRDTPPDEMANFRGSQAKKCADELRTP